ncbi:MULTISPECIES: hypothetical protein [unclassified Pseudomonas]|uniref:hypothetical protein n=1 Tax=unclassified Pseudomonas TaxID=196821 RepID=UPI00244B07E7|nr:MULTISPECIES: hypothetical protein [unclassified Pseudomonas]MDH0896710.1 hypothetical protein [Pseudomonas sp. GD03875]MDH1066464.1 hypothetical protein [Pseudomonas sp. GD03985]
MNPSVYSLNIELASHFPPQAENLSPPDWPPPVDFPIVINAEGKVVSRMGDSVWDLTIWSDRIISINFDDQTRHKGSSKIDKRNADIFRQLAAWKLYGPNSAITAKGLVRYCEILKPIFILCTAEKICASELMRYPRVIERIPNFLARSSAKYALTLLHELWESRASVGVEILDPYFLQKLSLSITEHQRAQTPYIPPRIWLYQVNRLRQCIDEFNEHQDKIEDCYHFCLDAYAHNAGSLANACQGKILDCRRPFYSGAQVLNGSRTNVKYYGKFRNTANRFGIDSLLSRWIPDYDRAGVKAFSSYFTLVSFVGIAYLLNFSMMRHEEGFSLRSNCLSSEKDPVTNEEIFLLESITTKTIEDEGAFWITSPSAKVALNALRTIAKLRFIAASAHPDVKVTALDENNPLLFMRAYEPWRHRGEHIDKPMQTKLTRQHYTAYIQRFPFLFDSEELRITDEDLKIARLINPDLDPINYAKGSIWPLSWHQLRRTGAVNMSASGLVGDASVQYQLKHARRGMSRYYGQGFFKLDICLNLEARTEYIRTMYEMIAKEFNALQNPRFVSPHGEKRKAQILNIISEKDMKSLLKAAQEGKIAFRQNFLGGCTYKGHCPYGGIDNIARCGGGDGKPPCDDLIYDRERAPLIRSLGDSISARLSVAPAGSPLELSLLAQQRAVENALNVLSID